MPPMYERKQEQKAKKPTTPQNFYSIHGAYTPF